MKRMWVVLLAAALILGMSGLVLADETGPGWDQGPWKAGEKLFAHFNPTEVYGVYTDFDTGLDFKVIENAEISGVRETDIEYNPAIDQMVGITIQTRANLPCFIEMTLVGNGGEFEGWSFGPGEKEIFEPMPTDHWMLFDPLFGGFVGENWNSVDPEVVREGLSGTDEYFLQACDLWKAEMFGNIGYKLTVAAAPLVKTGDSGETLLIEMRHNFNGQWSNGSELTAVQTNVAEFTANSSNDVYMQFRVPFSNQVAGEYDGTITFKMVSI